MRIYYHDESDAHPTATHDSTGEYLGLDELKRIGVLGYTGQGIEQVDAIAQERGYVARDEVCAAVHPSRRAERCRAWAKRMACSHMSGFGRGWPPAQINVTKEGLGDAYESKIKSERAGGRARECNVGDWPG